MKKISLKQRILNYLDKRGDFVSSGEIQRLSMQVGYFSPSNASRRLRELAEDEKLEVKYINGHAWYKTVSPKKRVVYRDPETKAILATVYE